MNTKINSATVTWITYLNFGTFLQAYALQKSILKLGYNNKILCDRRIVTPKRRFSLRMFLRKIKLRILNRDLSERLYKKFKKKHLIIDTEIDFKKINAKYQVMLCGSDQIWSPYLKFTPYYYLDFYHGKKIAYAPSIGTATWPKEYITNTKPLLRQFSALSVREKESAIALNQELGLEVHTVLDPTLLLRGEEWKQQLLEKDKRQGGYILCYFLTPTSWYLEYVKEYAKKQNKSIKIFDTHSEYSHFGENVAAGPQEFLSMINAADEIFTDSFHATIFSILFHKKFVTFKRFKDGGEKDQNLRLYNLFTLLDLKDYFIGEEELGTLSTLNQPNYKEIDIKLEKLRNDSLSYLKKSLSE